MMAHRLMGNRAMDVSKRKIDRKHTTSHEYLILNRRLSREEATDLTYSRSTASRVSGRAPAIAWATASR